MGIKEIISSICAILSALFAGASFTFYKKTVNINGNYKNDKKKYKKVTQISGNGGKNVVGDNNKL